MNPMFLVGTLLAAATVIMGLQRPDVPDTNILIGLLIANLWFVGGHIVDAIKRIEK